MIKMVTQYKDFWYIGFQIHTIFFQFFGLSAILNFKIYSYKTWNGSHIGFQYGCLKKNYIT